MLLCARNVSPTGNSHRTPNCPTTNTTTTRLLLPFSTHVAAAVPATVVLCYSRIMPIHVLVDKISVGYIPGIIGTCIVKIGGGRSKVWQSLCEGECKVWVNFIHLTELWVTGYCSLRMDSLVWWWSWVLTHGRGRSRINVWFRGMMGKWWFIIIIDGSVSRWKGRLAWYRLLNDQVW